MYHGIIDKKQESLNTNLLSEIYSYQHEQLIQSKDIFDYNSMHTNVDWGNVLGYQSNEVAPIQGKGIPGHYLTERTQGNSGIDISRLSLLESPEMQLTGMLNPYSGRELDLPENLSESIKSGFGIDMGKLSLLESPEVAHMGAKATAQGNVIRFAPGQYNPDTTEGLKILGHELNHVREQAQGNIQANIEGTNIHYDLGHEASSDRMGEAFASGELSGATPVSLGSAEGAAVQGLFGLFNRNRRSDAALPTANGTNAPAPSPTPAPNEAPDSDYWDSPEVMLSYIAERNGGNVTYDPYYVRRWLGLRRERHYSVNIDINGEQSSLSTRNGDVRMVNGQWIANSEHLMDNHGLEEHEATHQSGDHFRTPESAALAWALSYHPRSGYTPTFEQGSEWGTWLYRKQYEKECEENGTRLENRYTFGRRPDSRGFDFVHSWDPGDGEAFENAEPIAFTHTHPTNAPPEEYMLDENFSEADARWARYNGFPLQLVTPRGYIREMSPNNNYGQNHNSNTYLPFNKESDYMSNVLPGNSNMFECESRAGSRRWFWQ
ncbi:MAG: DUF4157 domain-containing protein [Defluviitaleaceae bacterium]|nr:DUF4157 domain-containing protein [Defluviitaleaceae bacterium]